MSVKEEIKELEDKIEELKRFSEEQKIDFSKQIKELEKNLEEKYFRKRNGFVGENPNFKKS